MLSDHLTARLQGMTDEATVLQERLADPEVRPQGSNRSIPNGSCQGLLGDVAARLDHLIEVTQSFRAHLVQLEPLLALRF